MKARERKRSRNWRRSAMAHKLAAIRAQAEQILRDVQEEEAEAQPPPAQSVDATQVARAAGEAQGAAEAAQRTAEAARLAAEAAQRQAAEALEAANQRQP